METEGKDPRPAPADCLGGEPGEQLARVQEFFRARGLFGHRLALGQGGCTYRITCDERAFAVFRVNEARGLPPGNPGWMVCRLDRDSLFEECRTPGLCQGHLACPHDLGAWLELIDESWKQGLWRELS